MKEISVLKYIDNDNLVDYLTIKSDELFKKVETNIKLDNEFNNVETRQNCHNILAYIINNFQEDKNIVDDEWLNEVYYNTIRPCFIKIIGKKIKNHKLYDDLVDIMDGFLINKELNVVKKEVSRLATENTKKKACVIQTRTYALIVPSNGDMFDKILITDGATKSNSNFENECDFIKIDEFGFFLQNGNLLAIDFKKKFAFKKEKNSDLIFEKLRYVLEMSTKRSYYGGHSIRNPGIMTELESSIDIYNEEYFLYELSIKIKKVLDEFDKSEIETLEHYEPFWEAIFAKKYSKLAKYKFPKS